MSLFIAETVDFRLDRRAVTRAGRADLTAVHRRERHIIAQKLVQFRVRPGRPTRELVDVQLARHKRKRTRIFVAGLNFETRIIDRSPVQTRRSAGFEAQELNPDLFDRVADRVRRRLAHSTAGRQLRSEVQDAAHKRSASQHDRLGAVKRIAVDADADDLERVGAVFVRAGRRRLDFQRDDSFLPEREIRRFFDDALDLVLIKPLVRLRSRAAHRRALANVQHSELQAGRVDRPPHRSAERVDFPNDVSLADAADRRIATHLRDRVEVPRQERRFRAHSRRRQRRFRPGVSGADDDHVEIVKRRVRVRVRHIRHLPAFAIFSILTFIRIESERSEPLEPLVGAETPEKEKTTRRSKRRAVFVVAVVNKDSRERRPLRSTSRRAERSKAVLRLAAAKRTRRRFRRRPRRTSRFAFGRRVSA